MKVFLLCLAILVVCIAFMCFNIIFRKNGQFPDGEINRSKEMKKLGIRCAKEEEMRLWGDKGKKEKPSCGDSTCSECASCGFYKKEE